MNNRNGRHHEPGNENPAEDKLPLSITSVKPQKRNRDRFSLFHNELFLVGISGRTLTDYSIQAGIELTPSLFQKLIREEEYQKIRDTFYRCLGRRDHASFELKKKAFKKGFSSEIIDNVLLEFGEKGLLDDETFALKYASDKTEFKKWGPNKILNALVSKGVQKQIAKKVTEKVSTDLEQDQICVDLAVKRKRHFLREEDLYKRKNKIYSYLSGKGYSSESIIKALPQITAELDA